MSDVPAGFAGDATATGAAAEIVKSDWLETALTVLFTAVAVLFVSFIVVVVGLV